MTDSTDATATSGGLVSGKQKAVVAFVITLITGLAVILAPYVTDHTATTVIQVVAAIASFVGTTFGVYQATNKP